jgi:pyrroloquinoline quinone (PQQ) biosynthesis protein C
MLRHQVEEFDHGEMALRDYAALGGDVAQARRRRQSPSAFAVAAVWRNIVHKRDPFAYLGAVYLFDALTPLVTAAVKDRLAGRLGRAKGLEFIIHHATADVEHERQIRQLLVEVMQAFPDSGESIVYGFEYFAHVYPLPVWLAAMRRAQRSLVARRVAAE